MGTLAHAVAAACAVQKLQRLLVLRADRTDKPLMVHPTPYTDLPTRRHLEAVKPSTSALGGSALLPERGWCNQFLLPSPEGPKGGSPRQRPGLSPHALSGRQNHEAHCSGLTPHPFTSRTPLHPATRLPHPSSHPASRIRLRIPSSHPSAFRLPPSAFRLLAFILHPSSFILLPPPSAFRLPPSAFRLPPFILHPSPSAASSFPP